MKEVWKRLIYQGKDYGDYYEVSNLGKIRNAKTKKIRKENVLPKGYCFVTGSLGSRNQKITFKNHRVVAETFLPNPDNLPEVNHKDGNKLNNQVSNLEWCTGAENMKHASEHGLLKPKCGEEIPISKLTADDVRYIRDNYIPRHYKFGTRGLGRKFNVDKETIRSVLNNKTWTHIK